MDESCETDNIWGPDTAMLVHMVDVDVTAKELATCGLQAHESPMHCLHTWQADQLRPFLHLPGRQRSCRCCWAHSADTLAGNAAHLDGLHLGNGLEV
jgi:hypothetical protein